MRRLPEVARWGLRIGTSLGIVAYVLTNVNRGDIWRALTGVRLEWLAVAVALYLAGQMLSALKWALLGRSVGLPGDLVEYGRFYFIGMFFNLLGISTLGGDVVRALYLGGGRRPGLALNSVVFDRVSGLAILMALGSVTLLAYPEYRFAGPIGTAVMAGGLALVLGWWTCPRLVKLLPEGTRLRRQVETELAPFWRDTGLLVRISALSLLFHLSQVCVQWVLARAAGATVPFTYCLVFHPVLSVMMALPVSISGFGVREAGYIYFLGHVGIDAAVAVMIGLLWWAVTAVAALVGGAIFLLGGAQLPKVRVPDEHRATA